MNNFISRYAKYDTHFNRTDPFKHHAWQEEAELPLWVKCSAGLGLVITLLALCFFN